MKTILTIIGARPQFIKSAALSKELLASSDFRELTLHTGQHYDPEMSDVFFNQLSLPEPTFRLSSGISGASHGTATGMMIMEIEKILLSTRPDFVLVYGDTNSTLAGALAACKLHIPVIHVEAGLRSFNMRMPEEVNRRLTDHVSSLLFAPSEKAVQNLVDENIDKDKIFVIGDVMLDCLNFFMPLAKELPYSGYILCTIHRQENTDDVDLLRQIFTTLIELSSEYRIILPIHPRTRKKAADLNLDLRSLEVIDPVGYLEMLALLKNCAFVMTDSGGLQKEAYYSGKTCITLRRETEWTELVEKKYNVLPESYSVTDVKKAIAQLANTKIEDPNIYGNGSAARLLIQSISAV